MKFRMLIHIGLLNALAQEIKIEKSKTAEGHRFENENRRLFF